MEEYLEKLEQAAKESETFEALLDNELREALNEVYQELKKIDNTLTDVKALDELPEELVNKFCLVHNLEVLPTFKSQLKTPYSIAKYLSLVVQQKELTTRIDDTLKTLLDINKISWVIHQNFTNTITFSKILGINSEEKPQGLLIKYRLDSETDKIIYTIAAGNWGWDITPQQLKALLEGDIPVYEKKSSDKMTYTISEDNIGIRIGNFEITVRKD